MNHKIYDVLIPTSSITVLAISLTPEMTTALSVLVSALFVGLLNLYSAKTARIVATKEIAKAIAPVEAKIAELNPVVHRIDTHVNGEKMKAESDLAARDLEISLLREMVSEMRTSVALQAQAKATSETSAVVAQAVAAALVNPTS